MKSQSKLCYYRLSVGQSILISSPHLGTVRQLMWGALSNERTSLSFSISAGPNQCSHSQVRGPLLSQIRDCPNLQGQVPVFISPGTGWPSYTPRHWVPFSSPPTTRRAAVEVFEPSSTRGLKQEVLQINI
jgi:hypothetical protein